MPNCQVHGNVNVLLGPPRISPLCLGAGGGVGGGVCVGTLLCKWEILCECDLHLRFQNTKKIDQKENYVDKS